VSDSIETNAWIEIDGVKHQLRNMPYRNDDDNLVFELIGGSDIIAKNSYLTSLRFGELDYDSSEDCQIELTQRYQTNEKKC